MMEGHRCKLCLKTFLNGRALGGHMRSHMLNLPLGPKPAADHEPDPRPSGHVYDQHTDHDDSASPSSSEEGEGTSSELRDNPKTSIRLVDQEFSFAAAAASVVLQDRESETESSKNPTRRRSKRSRRIKPADQHRQEHDDKARKFLKLDTISNNQASKTESWTEAEPAASSISNGTTEEDVAFCLMLLSKDRWNRETEDEETEKYTADETEEDSSEAEEHLKQSCKNRSSRGKYKCETCNKVFKSYQALGGHRASHKKIRVDSPKLDPVNAATPHKKIHECPVCYRVFSSGQALGGHKRSHVMAGVVVQTSVPRSSRKLGDHRSSSSSFIDLNLPAPPEELEDFSQIELSAVSDAEFVNQTRR